MMGIFSKYKINLNCIIVLAMFLFPCFVFAQSNAGGSKAKSAVDSGQSEKEITQTIQKHINVLVSRALSRYMKKNSYKVLSTVEADMSEGQVIPYLPRPRSIGSMSLVTYEAIDDLMRSANVKILLDKEYGKQDIDIVRKILVSEFSVFDDKLSFEFEPTVFPKQLVKDDPRLKKAEEENSKLKSANDDIKSVKQRLENKLEDLSETVKKKDDEIKKLGQSLNWGNLIKTRSPMLFSVLAVFLGLVLLALVFRGFGRALSNSITAVSSSLSEVGQSIASSAESDSDSDEAATESMEGGRAQESNVSMSLEELKKQIVELQGELKEQITDKEIPRLISYLKQGLSDVKNKTQMVLAMELLGSVTANRLFGLLDSKNKSIILEEIGVIDKLSNKIELMFKAGEGLKTALFSENYQGLLTDGNADVMKYLTIAKDRHIYELLDGLSQAQISRLVLYLESTKTSEILEYCYIHKKEVYETALSAIAEIDSIKEVEKIDKVISDTLSQIIENDETEKRLPYLMHIQKIIENISNGTELEIAESVGKNSPIIKTFIDENLVTMGMFFSMEPDHQQAILDGMNNKNIAAVVVIRNSETDSEAIYKALPERRVNLIKDEVTKVEGLAEDKKKQRFASAKQNIITHIMEAKASQASQAEAPIENNDLDSVA